MLNLFFAAGCIKQQLDASSKINTCSVYLKSPAKAKTKMDNAYYFAITRLEIDKLSALPNVGADVAKINDMLHLMCETIINHNCRDWDIHSHTPIGLELARSYCNMLLGKTSIDKNRLDLSPWHILNVYNDLMLRIDNRRRNAEDSDEMFDMPKDNVDANAAMMLMALPSKIDYRRPGYTAVFMETNDQGMTPLMYGMHQIKGKHTLTALLNRGGFSADEWRSGAVIGLLAECDDYIADHMAKHFDSDLKQCINMEIPTMAEHFRGDPNARGTVLHKCCNTLQSMRIVMRLIFLMKLGADYRIKDSAGHTPLDIINARLQQGYRYENRDLIEVFQYLSHLAPN